MGSREKIDITGDLKDLHQNATAALYILNRIIPRAYRAEGHDDTTKDYYHCESNEEAKSFFISIATESPLSAEQIDIVLASWALFDGYPDDDNITTRREQYLEEREEYDSSYIKGSPFKDLVGKPRKNRIDGLNKLSIYPIINQFFNSQPNLMEYIAAACKRHIIDVDGKKVVVLPTPSYKLTCNTYSDTIRSEEPSDIPAEAVEAVDAEAVSLQADEDKTEVSIAIASNKRWIKPLIIAIVGVVIVAGILLIILAGRNNSDRINAIPHFSGSDSIDLDLKLSNDIAKLQEDVDYRAELIAGAEQGNAEDQFWLAVYYDQNREYGQAERWYLLAADQDYIPAQSLLCLLYSKQGINEEEMYKWAVRAADGNDALGWFFVGWCYNKGIVLDTDYLKAATFYQCVIDGKNPDGEKLHEPLKEYNEIIAKCFAENELAILYHNGTGVEQNDAEALRLFKAAYDDGYVNAALHIAEFYYYGYGVKEDRDTAHLWYLKASEKN